MESYLQKYREMIWHTSQTLGPVPRLEGTSAKDIADQLWNMVPLHKLEARKKWRDDCLAALNKLRNELETI